MFVVCWVVLRTRAYGSFVLGTVLPGPVETPTSYAPTNITQTGGEGGKLSFFDVFFDKLEKMSPESRGVSVKVRGLGWSVGIFFLQGNMTRCLASLQSFVTGIQLLSTTQHHH